MDIKGSPAELERLTELVKRAGDMDDVILTSDDGSPVVAVLSIEHYERLFDAADEAAAYRALAEWDAEGRPPGRPIEEVWPELAAEREQQA